MAKVGKSVKMQWHDGDKWVDITDPIKVMSVSELEKDMSEFISATVTISFTCESMFDEMMLLRLQAEMYAEQFRN